MFCNLENIINQLQCDVITMFSNLENTVNYGKPNWFIFTIADIGN